MEIIFEIIFHFFIEVLGQAFFELVAELGLRGIGNATGWEKPRSPYMSLIGYVILATVCGAISILFFKNHFIKNEELRIINLLLTPVLLGLIMHFKGKRMDIRHINKIRLDSFWFGFSFALSFGLVRYFFAK